MCRSEMGVILLLSTNRVDSNLKKPVKQFTVWNKLNVLLIEDNNCCSADFIQ